MVTIVAAGVPFHVVCRRKRLSGHGVLLNRNLKTWAELDESDFPIWRKKLGHSPRKCVEFGGPTRERKPLALRAKSEKLTGQGALHMNPEKYMVTLDRPTGIRFVQTLDGKVFVDAVSRNGNADKTRMIMVGDFLVKVASVDVTADAQDFRHAMKVITESKGPISLIFERSFPFSRSRMRRIGSEELFNVGRVSVSTWNGNNMVSPYQPSDQRQSPNVGFVTYSSKYFRPKVLQALAMSVGIRRPDNFRSGSPCRGMDGNSTRASLVDHQMLEVIESCADEEIENTEWTHGSFNKEEYISGLERAECDAIYNPARGISYTKITESIWIGSCIQEEQDFWRLVENAGVTAVLNLQRRIEQENWGINYKAIENVAQKNGVVINWPIREADAADLRQKLPFAVGLLYRLLRKGHRVYISCTTGLDRSPACLIGYMHWVQDVPLQDAVDYITQLHPCRPDRSTLVWATWDLIAAVERGAHKGLPTHAVEFVWTHGCRDGGEVLLVGDFDGGWETRIKAVHAGGQKYTVNLRLPQGKYNYKFIVDGSWRHSSSVPTERDAWGNINNVIRIGGVATSKFDALQESNVMKDLNTIRVIERPLTEDERFTLAFASRRLAFAIHPVTFTAK